MREGGLACFSPQSLQVTVPKVSIVPFPCGSQHLSSAFSFRILDVLQRDLDEGSLRNLCTVPLASLCEGEVRKLVENDTREAIICHFFPSTAGRARTVREACLLALLVQKKSLPPLPFYEGETVNSDHGRSTYFRYLSVL